MDGENSRCQVEHPDGTLEELAYTKQTRRVDQGDTVTIITPGGGGWGDPLEREAEKVLWDINQEFISPERAKNYYGVVVEKKGFRRYVLDEKETESLREAMKTQKQQYRKE